MRCTNVRKGGVVVEFVDVVLVRSGPRPIDVIRAIRDVTCSERVVKLMDLREAKRRVDTAPCVVVPNVPWDAGERIMEKLQLAGATVELKQA
jgi:large subunit ribosomal protein L7/L12